MKQFRWIIDNPNDVIQHCLSNNRFYELDELQFMSEFIKEDDVLMSVTMRFILVDLQKLKQFT